MSHSLVTFETWKKNRIEDEKEKCCGNPEKCEAEFYDGKDLPNNEVCEGVTKEYNYLYMYKRDCVEGIRKWNSYVSSCVNSEKLIIDEKLLTETLNDRDRESRISG